MFLVDWSVHMKLQHTINNYSIIVMIKMRHSSEDIKNSESRSKNKVKINGTFNEKGVNNLLPPSKKILLI